MAIWKEEGRGPPPASEFRHERRLTERVFARLAELEHVGRQHALILNAVSDGLLGYDADGRLVFANPSALRMLGRSAEELLGRRLHELIHHTRPDGGRSAEVECRVLAALREGSACRVEDDVFWRADGTGFPVEYTFTPHRDADGARAGGVLAFRDLTERRRIEAELLRAQRLDSIGALAGGMAHDLNNVLTPILMGLDLLRAELTDPGSRALLATLQETAQRGADMVQQVLSFARGAEGQRRVLSLGPLLDELARLLRQSFPRDVEVRVEAAAGLWPLAAEATQLHQVLMNLCVNARDAMPCGGRLTVAARNRQLDAAACGHPEARPGPYVVLDVTDTGTGIAAEHLGRIFEPFFTTKAPGRGSGLGLSTVAAIVRRHGGFVTVTSAPGRGTAFAVHLPALPGPAADEAQPPDGAGELLLLVDDEESLREVTRAALEASGYRVLAARTVAEALALYGRHRGAVRAVLLDLLLPGLDGPAVVAALRRLDPGVHILVSSNAPADAAGLGGVGAVLPAPYTAADLLRALAGLLREPAGPRGRPRPGAVRSTEY